MYLKKISEQEEMVDDHISFSGLGLLPTFPERAYFVALYLVNEVYSTIIKGCS
jgi:hypothetical protein